MRDHTRHSGGVSRSQVILGGRETLGLPCRSVQVSRLPGLILLGFIDCSHYEWRVKVGLAGTMTMVINVARIA